MIRAVIQRVILWLGARLHGTTREQWQHVLDLVLAAESSFKDGAKKLAWVKDQLAAFIESPRGRAIFGALADRAKNWLIETAVGFLRHV